MGYRTNKSAQQLIKSGSVIIQPYHEMFQGPNMYYCHMGNVLLVPKPGKLADTRSLAHDLYDRKVIGEYYDLLPGEFILAETFESFSTDTKHAIRIFNSSSLARLGVSQCALGMINPGCGLNTPIRLTLELVNNGPFTVRLYPTKPPTDVSQDNDWGTEILKVAIIDYEPAELAYQDWEGSLYGGDIEVKGSLIDKRYKNE